MLGTRSRRPALIIFFVHAKADFMGARAPSPPARSHVHLPTHARDPFNIAIASWFVTSQAKAKQAKEAEQAKAKQAKEVELKAKEVELQRTAVDFTALTESIFSCVCIACMIVSTTIMFPFCWASFEAGWTTFVGIILFSLLLGFSPSWLLEARATRTVPAYVFFGLVLFWPIAQAVSTDGKALFFVCAAPFCLVAGSFGYRTLKYDIMRNSNTCVADPS